MITHPPIVKIVVPIPPVDGRAESLLSSTVISLKSVNTYTSSVELFLVSFRSAYQIVIWINCITGWRFCLFYIICFLRIKSHKCKRTFISFSYSGFVNLLQIKILVIKKLSIWLYNRYVFFQFKSLFFFCGCFIDFKFSTCQSLFSFCCFQNFYFYFIKCYAVTFFINVCSNVVNYVSFTLANSNLVCDGQCLSCKFGIIVV